MTTPERRYRRWLWAYPKEYRNVHGEEILSTLLDANSEGGRYARLDFFQVMAHGTHVRLTLTAKRFGRGTLPRSVRGAIACLLVVAVLNLVESLTAHKRSQESWRSHRQHHRGVRSHRALRASQNMESILLHSRHGSAHRPDGHELCEHVHDE
jgi:hypothetical protein